MEELTASEEELTGSEEEEALPPPKLRRCNAYRADGRPHEHLQVVPATPRSRTKAEQRVVDSQTASYKLKWEVQHLQVVAGTLAGQVDLLAQTLSRDQTDESWVQTLNDALNYTGHVQASLRSILYKKRMAMEAYKEASSSGQ